MPSDPRVAIDVGTALAKLPESVHDRFLALYAVVRSEGGSSAEAIQIAREMIAPSE